MEDEVRGAVEFGQPHAFLKSNYLIEVDTDLCSDCGSCVNRCQFGALSIDGNKCRIDTQRCVGCGVCSVVCPSGAMSLILRPESERTIPPVSVQDWMMQKTASRTIDNSDLF